MRKASDNTVSNDKAMPRLTTFTSLTAFLALALILAAAIFPADTFAQGGPPPGGIIYYGNVSVNGAPAPDGETIVGRVGDYESKPVAVSEGKYAALSVAAEASLAGQTISFFLGGAPADQTDIYQPHGIPVIKTGFDLTFSALPEPTATATPEPSAPPSDTPLPAPTSPPAQPDPTASPTPEVAEPMVFVSGLIFAQGVPRIPADSILTARIGEYQSIPAAAIAADGAYGGLVVDPGDPSFTGGEIRFFLNGIQARTTAVFNPGKLESAFDILFTDYPTPIPTHTPIPTNTPIPTPTNTPIPTQTPVPTPAPPTSTPAPTRTPVPTQTPVPTNTPPPPPTSVPAPTSAPPTSEPPPAPTVSPPEEAGGCFSAASVSPLTGAANALLLIAPLGLIGLIRARRKQTGD